MRFQIVQLESHEDLASARDRLAASKADRVLLVWPRHGQILQRQLDLKLLQRQAARRGVRLALLTFDPQVRANAARLGVIVFGDLEAAADSEWPEAVGHEVIRNQSADDDSEAPARPPRTAPRTGVGRQPGPVWIRILAAGLATLSILGMGMALLPSAEVRLLPATQTRLAEFSLDLDPELQPQDISPEAIPAYEHETVASVEAVGPATGSLSVPADSSTGEARFTNLTGDQVEIPRGTSVRTRGTNSLRFETQSAASLPAEKGSSVTVPIRAAEPGPGGNVAADSIGAVDGPLGLSVSVTNLEPLTGGTLESRQVVSQADLDRLLENTILDLQKAAQMNLEASLPAGESLLISSLQVIEPLEPDFSRAAGDAGASVQLRLTAAVRATAYRPSEAVLALKLAAARRTPPGWEIEPQSVSVSSLRPTTTSAGIMQVALTGNWRVFNTRAVDRAVASLRGDPLAEAQLTLQGEEALDRSVIEISPAWWTRLPIVPMRIQVRVDWDLR